MNVFTISVARCAQNPQNTEYPLIGLVGKQGDLLVAAQRDHIAGRLEGRRCDANMQYVDCVIMDCDNDDDSVMYNPEDVIKYIGDVQYYTTPSRHNNLVKHAGKPDEKSARPRWHAYFPLSKMMKPEESEAIRKKIYAQTRDMFDRGAGGASRFIYGKPDLIASDIKVFEGRPVDVILSEGVKDTQKESPPAAETGIDKISTPDDVIPAGRRHKTLLDTAIKAVNNHKLEDAKRIFENACARCKPATPADEAKKIWEWAVEHKDDERRVHRERVSSRKGTVTMKLVEDVLREKNITLEFNVISRLARVSELPADSDLIPEAYGKLSPRQRVKSAEKLLPVFIKTYFEQEGKRVSSRMIEDELACIADLNRYNPVREMIVSKEWDGEDRITHLTEKVLNLNSHDATLVRKWLHQAVAMGLNDEGEYANQFMLVLQGAQGIGKTELFRHLAYEASLFGEGLSIDMKNKDSIIQASTVWIGEIGELDSTLKREQANLKSFITAKFDTYRKPYARNAEQVERHTCFCGTVNPEQVLRDETGHRRYVILHVDGLDLNFIHNQMTKEWVQQLWAQVYLQLYLPAPGAFFLTQEEQRELKQTNTKYVIPLEGETELSDRLAWDASHGSWEYRTLTYLKASLDLKIDPRKIGRALIALLEKHNLNPKELRRLVNGRTEYLLPPLRPGICDDGVDCEIKVERINAASEAPKPMNREEEDDRLLLYQSMRFDNFRQDEEQPAPKPKTRRLKDGGIPF